MYGIVQVADLSGQCLEPASFSKTINVHSPMAISQPADSCISRITSIVGRIRDRKERGGGERLRDFFYRIEERDERILNAFLTSVTAARAKTSKRNTYTTGDLWNLIMGENSIIPEFPGSPTRFAVSRASSTLMKKP